MFEHFHDLHYVRLAMAPEGLGTRTSASFLRATAIDGLRCVLITFLITILSSEYLYSTTFRFKEYTAGQFTVHLETPIYFFLGIFRQI